MQHRNWQCPKCANDEFETGVFRATGGRTKLIEGTGDVREFYALDQDPAERHPDALAGQQRARLSGALEGLRKLTSRRRSRPRNRAIDAATRQRMRALGYVD